MADSLDSKKNEKTISKTRVLIRCQDISKIDVAEKDETSSKVLIIHDLDALKEKIAKVVIMVLIVTFFKYAINFHYGEMINLLYLSIGILLIAVSIYLTHKSNHSAGHGSK